MSADRIRVEANRQECSFCLGLNIVVLRRQHPFYTEFAAFLEVEASALRIQR